jgi:hypothetical protein
MGWEKSIFQMVLIFQVLSKKVCQKDKGESLTNMEFIIMEM